jgi:excisionase family DNA binding protein
MRRMNKSLTSTEAAARLGISTARVRRLVLDGRLPAQKFGRDLVINEADLKLYEPRKGGRPPGKVSTANKAATQPASGSNAALTAAKAKKRGKK